MFHYHLHTEMKLILGFSVALVRSQRSIFLIPVPFVFANLVHIFNRFSYDFSKNVYRNAYDAYLFWLSRLSVDIFSIFPFAASVLSKWKSIVIGMDGNLHIAFD